MVNLAGTCLLATALLAADAPSPAPVNPQAELLTRQVLSLPVHPGLSADDLAWIVESVTTYPRAGAGS